MIRSIIRVLLTALAFAFLLPMLPGIDLHGNFGIAIVAAIFFGIAGWLVDLAALTLSTIFTVSTLGLALLWLIPLWLVGFWMLPVFALKLVAHMMPTHLTIHGWLPAIEGGLIMLVIGTTTANWKRKA